MSDSYGSIKEKLEGGTTKRIQKLECSSW
jgi:hypothetical protein